MVKERIPIPEEQKTRLLVEAGHKCSIPGCNVKEDWVFHHINFDPSDNRDENILVLCPNHAAMVDKKKISQKACEQYMDKVKLGHIGKEQESIKEVVEREGIDLEPESDIRKLAIIYGRKYLMWRYGRYDVTPKREITALIIIGVVSIIPFPYEVWQMSKGVTANLFVLYVSVFLLILAMASFGMLGLTQDTKCKKCDKYFGIRVVDSKQVDQKEIYKTESEIKMQITVRNTYECEYCGNRQIKNEQFEKIIPINSRI